MDSVDSLFKPCPTVSMDGNKMTVDIHMDNKSDINLSNAYKTRLFMNMEFTMVNG